MVRDEGIAHPILLGNQQKIQLLAQQHNLDLTDMPIIDPVADTQEQHRNDFGDLLWNKRQRRGLTQYDARKQMRDRNYFGCMMVEQGMADAMISGLTRKYAQPIRPALHIIDLEIGVKKVAGLYIMVTKKGPYFFADTTMNADPTAEELADIALLTASKVQQFNVKPRMALLSYTNFGSTPGAIPNKVSKAVEILHKQHPDLIVDGDIQANFALNNNLLKEQFPFSKLVDQNVNTFIFPNLAAGNIAYKMMQELSGAEAIGPVLMGLKKPVHILQLGSSVREIENMIIIAVIDAQKKN